MRTGHGYTSLDPPAWPGDPGEILHLSPKKARDDILSRFILESEKDPETMNDHYLRDMVLGFLIAGKDTTGNTLTWFFYMLCKNTVVQDKVAFEITEYVEWAQEDTSMEMFTARLKQGAIDKMHYLHAAITETLRLYPGVPVAQTTALAIYFKSRVQK